MSQNDTRNIPLPIQCFHKKCRIINYLSYLMKCFMILSIFGSDKKEIGRE